VAPGRKLAVVTLALELVLAIALTAKNLGLFALMAMPFVGIAWLPAGIMMLSDLRQDSDARPLSYVAAGLSFAAGAACLAISAKWVITPMFGK
jgi:hypothetical protein